MAAVLTNYPDYIKFSRDQFEFYPDGSVYTDSRFSIELSITSDVSGTTTLAPFWQYGSGFNNFSERLHAYYTETTIYWPSYGATALLRNYSLANYSYSIQEWRGSPLAVEGSALTFYPYNYYMLPGGNAFDKYQSNIWLVNYNGQYLTCAPTSKRTLIGMQEFLSFLAVSPQPVNFKTHVTLTYQDGTTSNYRITTASGTVPAWDILCWRVPCSYAALNIAANATGTVWYYEVVIEDNSNNPITEIRRFVIDRTPYNKTRKILWKNSRGGEDSFYFTGNEKFNADYNHTTSNNFVSSYYDVKAGSSSMANMTEQPKIATGTWLESKELANWMRDLRLAEYLYEDDGSQFLPIEILPGTFNIYDDEKTGYQVEFEYRYRFLNHSYTP